jgi:hypothetical protein
MKFIVHGDILSPSPKKSFHFVIGKC